MSDLSGGGGGGGGWGGAHSVQHNFELLMSLSPFYRKMFTDLQITQKFKCCPTKTVSILKQASNSTEIVPATAVDMAAIVMTLAARKRQVPRKVTNLRILMEMELASSCHVTVTLFTTNRGVA